MPNAADIAWFKQNFAADILPKVSGTPFDIDMLAAIACQETGEIWTVLRKKNLPRDQILALCTGDTIDARSVFPRSRAELEAEPRGAEMFQIAHAALVAMAAHIPGYAGVAAKPNKFCHGYGMFQYDIQFYKVDPDYFLQRRYETFEGTLGKCLDELRNAQKRLGWNDRTSLTDLEKAAVAICYNTGFGNYRASKGLKQGHFDGTHFYGENFFDYLQLAHTVPTPNGPPAVISPPAPDTAIVPPPAPVTATGATYEVDVESTPLNVRTEPLVDATGKNARWKLPDGHLVKAVGTPEKNGFLEIETSLNGALIRGWSSAKFLRKLAEPEPVPVVVPAAAMPTTGVVAALLTRAAPVRRTEAAGPFTVNEPGLPSRKGNTAAELRASIATIIDWLAVEKPTHLRYKPKGGTTFCNIYAHDYCALAGVYLPRVWWNGPAIEKLARGETVVAKYAVTVDEIRANGLFRWLRDYGPRFGWRRVATLTDLQAEANAGAVAVIVARRTEEGKSGHIVAVVPETAAASARRNAAGQVIAPLQSQAGVTNFRYGTSTIDWWKGAQFAESAFWVHA